MCMNCSVHKLVCVYVILIYVLYILYIQVASCMWVTNNFVTLLDCHQRVHIMPVLTMLADFSGYFVLRFSIVTSHCILWFIITVNSPSPPLDNIRVMVIVWRLRGNIIRTVVFWIVWYNVHSQQHTYMSSSYRSNRLGLSHWDPYAVRRGGWSASGGI